MTSKFSIDNRELLQRISSGEAVVGIDFGNLIVRELAAFRLAAMDSESGYLPLDYLQGHKDGLEWAAQLAEANHPETGDWLYDDPIELAKAIRKGPDMPPEQPVEDSEPDRNPVLAYADSYRDMAKQGVESVPIWSVITDLERNIAPLYRHAQQPVVDIEPTQMFGIGSIFKPQVVSEQEADCDDCAHYNPKICHGEGCPAISQQSPQPAPVVSEDLYKLANHIASSKNGLPDEWQDWAEELEADIRRAAMLQTKSLISINPAPAMVSLPKNAESMTGNYPVIPEGYVMVPKDPTEQMYDAGDRQMATKQVWDAMLAAAPQPQNAQQNIPEIIPGWIPVSERLPEKNQSVLISVNFDSSLVDPLICTARYTGSTFRRGEATVKPGSGIEEVTHWMALPAAPQESINALIPLVSRNERGAK